MTHAADQAPFWEKQPEESDRAYDAFTRYRDAAVVRSLRAVARELDKSLTLIGRWSSEHMWVSRCEAFDAEEARARSLRLQAEREKQLDAHLTLSKLGVKGRRRRSSGSWRRGRTFRCVACLP